ncbi:hypothetical protein ACFV7R_38190 [Streptomyces sp. NPDC059866]|uniref:hypothetical protein n=1 Tax=Streptomyces sp. NPDC059866 TaxID=3346978 RepID=UPI00365F5E08
MPGAPLPQYALHHDPDYPQLLADAREKAQGWTDGIAKAVKAVDEADQSVKRALARATSDVSTDGIGIGGFNASAVGDLAKAGKPDPKTTTKTDGWVSEGESGASGPGVGTSVTGPHTGAGKLGEAEAHADLGRASAEGSLTNGPMKLAGEAEAYAGAGLDGVQLGGETFAGAKGRLRRCGHRRLARRTTG